MMNTPKSTCTLLVALLVIFGATITRSFALAGDLTEPGLALPSGFPESARARIMEALQHRESEFLGGSFINSFTSLRYSGETRTLNQFLAGLANCPGATVAVRFDTNREASEPAWIVSHLAGKPWDFTVHINVNSPRIRLEWLVIPESKGPPFSEKDEPTTNEKKD